MDLIFSRVACWGLTFLQTPNFHSRRREERLYGLTEKGNNTRTKELNSDWVFFEALQNKADFLVCFKQRNVFLLAGVGGFCVSSAFAPDFPSEARRCVVLIDAVQAHWGKARSLQRWFSRVLGMGFVRVHMGVLRVKSGLHHLTNVFQKVAKFHAIRAKLEVQ